MEDRVDLVIFDCDGTLVDSEVLSIKVDQRVLADHGWNLSQEEIVARFMGRTSTHFTRELESFLGRDLPPNWELKYQQWYADAFEQELTPIAGVENALLRILMPTCVASNSRHARLEQTLGLTGLLPRFSGRIFSAEDVRDGKPAPDLFLHAAQTMGVPPKRCLVVEDSRFGVQAARAAGMRVLGYAGGLTPPEWLEGPQTTVFKDMEELPALITAAHTGCLRPQR
ncbi:HAD family hydrolase [Arthrobacter humicola]|uniref:HAD family hydrolase n=1 Tax=Arthrobacter humicola TaxID=409291 RepID=UPI001FAB6AFE|nr:HAD family hydrolase [Arthrobacter humicola]MCI9870481.1 HAD family hydrolase [Arthrobacter humicola]